MGAEGSQRLQWQSSAPQTALPWGRRGIGPVGASLVLSFIQEVVVMVYFVRSATCVTMEKKRGVQRRSGSTGVVQGIIDDNVSVLEGLGGDVHVQNPNQQHQSNAV